MCETWATFYYPQNELTKSTTHQQHYRTATLTYLRHDLRAQCWTVESSLHVLVVTTAASLYLVANRAFQPAHIMLHQCVSFQHAHNWQALSSLAFNRLIMGLHFYFRLLFNRPILPNQQRQNTEGIMSPHSDDYLIRATTD